MATSRAQQLEKLAKSLPGANQQIQQGLEQARQTQLQQSIKQARPGAGTAVAQQLGAQQTAQAGQAQLQGQQQQAQQATQLGQLGLQQMGREQRGRAAGQQIALDERQMELSNQLNKIDAGLKDKLLDQQMSFKRDQAGNALLNERQLMDWALQQAQSKEELADYVAASNRAHDRKLAMYRRAYDLIANELREQKTAGQQEFNQKVTIDLQNELNAMEAAYKQAAAEKANAAARNSAILGTLGTVAGGVGGFMVGGPAGAAAGASIGGSTGASLGTLIS